MTVGSDPPVRSSSLDDELPDLGSEAVDAIPDFVLDPDVHDPPSDDLIADPLPPADSTAVGVLEVEGAINRARRVTLFSSTTELGPVPLTGDQLRAMVRSIRQATQPVIVTSRFEDPDLVINTLEYMPPREVRRAVEGDDGDDDV